VALRRRPFPFERRYSMWCNAHRLRADVPRRRSQQANSAHTRHHRRRRPLRVRTGSAPSHGHPVQHSLLRLNGWAKTAQANRHFAISPHDAIELLRLT
jgi:hypothetical protein